MRNIYISSNAFPVREIDAIFAECDMRGISKIELGSGVAHDPDAAKKIKERSKRSTIVLHNYMPAPQDPFTLNLASMDKEELRKSIELATNALHISAEIHAPLYAVHAGFAFSAAPTLLGGRLTNAPHVSLQDAKKQFMQSMSRLSAVAVNVGVSLLVENNSVPSFNLIEGENRSCLVAGIEDSQETMRELAGMGIHLLIDVGHVNVTSHALQFNPVDYIERLREYVAAFHISDNDGSRDQHLPATDRSWFLETVRRFPKDTFITLETEGYLEETIATEKLFTA